MVILLSVKRFLDAENPESANMEIAVDHTFHVAIIVEWKHVDIVECV